MLRREGLDIPVILVSGALGDVTAVECIKQGATDYVLKDGLARLPEAIRRALQEKRFARTAGAIRCRVAGKPGAARSFDPVGHGRHRHHG